MRMATSACKPPATTAVLKTNKQQGSLTDERGPPWPLWQYWAGLSPAAAVGGAGVSQLVGRGYGSSDGVGSWVVPFLLKGLQLIHARPSFCGSMKPISSAIALCEVGRWHSLTYLTIFQGDALLGHQSLYGGAFYFVLVHFGK